MTSMDREPHQDRPPTGRPAHDHLSPVLDELVAEIVAREVAAPVDTAALADRALAGAARIRRRRRAVTTAAAAVLLATPVALAGLRLGHPTGPPAVAARATSTDTAATASLDAAPVSPQSTASQGPRTIRFSAGGQPVEVTFTPRTETIGGTTATTTGPAVTVTGGPLAVQNQVRATFDRRIDALRGAYRERVATYRAADLSPAQSIGVSATARWRQTITVVLEADEDVPGARPLTVTAPVVIDTRTGRAVAAETLLTDVAAADALMREAVTAATQPGALAPARLARLTMRQAPGRSAEPAGWYPTDRGITWVIDDDGSTPDQRDTITVTVPWPTLASLLRPQRR